MPLRPFSIFHTVDIAGFIFLGSWWCLRSFLALTWHNFNIVPRHLVASMYPIRPHPFFTLFISSDSFFRARNDAWDHFSLSLGTISTLCPDILLPRFARHIGRHQIVPHFLHEPSTPVILPMFRYFATIHSPCKEAHQCSPSPSFLVIINVPWLNTSSLPGHSFCSVYFYPLLQSLLICFQTP